MKTRNVSVIRVKRRKRNGIKHHGGSWKIAYADFMTAMMAFFLVMWLLAISSPQELTRIAEYFRTPLQVAINKGERSSDSSNPIPGGGEDVLHQEGDILRQVEVVEANDEARKLNRLREQLDQLIITDPRLKALRPHLLIDMMDEGLRIQIIDRENRPMFMVGSAKVESYMSDILRAIAPILNDIPNKISLSGHTDDLKYANGERGYSNWELSADRANASRRELLIGGLDEVKILRVVGMASTVRLKQEDASAPVNRRISILVLNKQAEERIEQQNTGSDSLIINDSKEIHEVIGKDSAESRPTQQSNEITVLAQPAPASQSAEPNRVPTKVTK
ncbi:flagellar motor protein MotB [Photorhabdus laumondii subsp. laumondii]|uniref:Chemotaxis protein n=2 Tax=Photorhabdus laumondii subsp. laumondii TaxID=141679 RepID=Q7N5T7_PHOLL|nr:MULTISPECIES: flagellar motor protein MotB [Photorhabdus]AWK41664.1 flagellar motor protein MotB [Photorhabdus laumondii subsp. laumondii]AXG42494.1 motility protein MotB [Photorhabdus laumondii subsp. laumondii]AXG46987.1 motility protein MotB [Photorhabdus laumondii subsp. laumondii]KTL59437.1 flagellar motor protein MotB [Photorhabdus laumondii subsp. laumondii]MCC8385774.1 flagellar motor protein MotB [Photorhabdus laumondii]